MSDDIKINEDLEWKKVCCEQQFTFKIYDRDRPIDCLLRIVSGDPITPREIRLAGLFALAWFVMDAVWFVGTILGWF